MAKKPPVFKSKSLAISIHAAKTIDFGNVCRYPTRHCPTATLDCAHDSFCVPDTDYCVGRTDCDAPTRCRFPTIINCRQPTLCLSPTKCNHPTFCIAPTRCDALTDCDNPTLCIAPTEIDCYFATDDCGFFSGGCGITDDCGVNYSTCYRTDIFVIDLEKLVINPDDIQVVREQLDEVMKAVQVRGAQVEADMKPQTVEQAELLEAELKEALKAVQETKKRLS